MGWECLDCHAIRRPLAREDTAEDGWCHHRIDVLPRGLAVGIDGDPGEGTYVGGICGEILMLSQPRKLVENSLLSKSVWITVMAGSAAVRSPTSSKSETDPSRMSALMENRTNCRNGGGCPEVGLGDSDGVTTVVDDGTCNEGERTVEGRDRDNAEADADTIAVGVGEGEGEEEGEGMVDGDSLEGLSSTALSWLGDGP